MFNVIICHLLLSINSPLPPLIMGRDKETQMELERSWMDDNDYLGLEQKLREKVMVIKNIKCLYKLTISTYKIFKITFYIMALSCDLSFPLCITYHITFRPPN